MTADGPEGIPAYSADTNSLEWKKEIDGMEKAGIAADDHGHLFVFDKENKSVYTCYQWQMVNIRDA